MQGAVLTTRQGDREQTPKNALRLAMLFRPRLCMLLDPPKQYGLVGNATLVYERPLVWGLVFPFRVAFCKGRVTEKLRKYIDVLDMVLSPVSKNDP